MKKFVQVDCETLGVTADSVVLSIGACFYDMDGFSSSIELFPSIEQQVLSGRSVSDSALMWWFSQPDAARKNIVNGERQPLIEVADEFVQWFNEARGDVPRENVWFSAFGNDFDLPLVTSLLGKYRTMPWDVNGMYRNKMCLRTLNEVYRNHIVWPEGDVAHTARQDAINQAKAHISLLQKFPELR